MARNQIRITPGVLKWARERARFSIEEMREKFQGKFRDIESWEQGESFPTYPQLEGLAEKYKVPVAVFFFPEPPEVPPIRESFRTLPDVRFDALPREMYFLLRKATAFQINLSELNGGQNSAERFILRDLRFSPGMDIPVMAQRVREYLGITLDVQKSWADSKTAFDAWRDVLETHGVAVFKDAFRNDSYSGFCLYHKVFPLIYVNNSVKTREIFTLFHELSHLLFHTSGVDVPGDELGEGLSPSDRQIEIMCNSFAAEFLLPASQFAEDIKELPPTQETAVQLADYYNISRESIFRRFLDRGDITQEEYRRAADEWSGQRQAGGNGGNYYSTKIAYLGADYINLALSQYHQDRISEPELADYLDMKVRNLDKLEGYFSRKSA